MNRQQKRVLKVSLKALYRAALSGVDPARAVEEAVRRPSVARLLRSARRVGVFVVGKAAKAMFEAAPRADAALVILPTGYPRPRDRRAQVHVASHPMPDDRSVKAARRALAFFRSFGSEDVILCLVSGGTSSLLCLPKKGVSLRQKRAAVERLVASGASIVEVNRLRKRLSAVKGGKLGRSTRARLVTLVLSDVPGDDPALVGSGPTVRRRQGDIVRVVGSNRSGLQAAAQEARRRGLEPRVLRKRLAGEARDAGRQFGCAATKLRAATALLAGGETTVALSRHHGHGGRNLEFALSAAQALEGARDVAVLSAGSDGIDGSSKAAGAVVDAATIARARGRGLDPEQTLARHDTESLLAKLGDILITGPTGTNVGDWAFAVRNGQV